MACDRSPGEGEGRGWRPLTRGCHEVTGGVIDRILGIKMGRPFRAAPERQLGSCKGTEAAQVPAERSGAACPDGAVTAGDWGWTDRISSGNPPNVSVTDSKHKFVELTLRNIW